jgi:two-component system sensor histidine kinase DesK
MSMGPSDVAAAAEESQPASVDWEPGGGLLIWLLLLIAPAVEAVAVRDGGAWWRIALLVAYAAGFTLVVRLFERGSSPRVRYPALVVFVLGGLALTVVFDLTAVFVVVFTSMAVAISLPLIRPAFLGLLAVTAGAMVVGIPGGVFAVIGLGFGTYIAGFVTFVMRRLFVTIVELHAARRELATAAVAQERLRFARDLHDLLGHSLSVIVVKAELIRRTATLDPAAAATAAADIEAVGRRALLEVRDAVSGYRRTDLRTEITRAEHTLSDAGITTTVQVPDGAVDPEADAILGWAVREGATNVLRHSRAGRCEIIVRTGADGTELTIADDGVGVPMRDATVSPDVASAGNGLSGLSERVVAAGGILRTGTPIPDRSTGTDGVTADDIPYGAKGFVLAVSLPTASRRQG